MTTQLHLLCADIQPDTNPDANPDAPAPPIDQVAHWRAARDGLAANFPGLHSVHIYGDLVDRGKTNASAPYTFDNLFDDLQPLRPRRRIITIPGNHDHDYNNSDNPEYLEAFASYLAREPRSFFHIIQGSTLWIYMGTMGTNVGGYIPDYVFYWFKSLVLQHKHKNIIVGTHQPLYGTVEQSNEGGGGANGYGANYIENSQRFISFLTSNPGLVQLWLCGHDAYDMTDLAHAGVVTAYGGTLFANCGLHFEVSGERLPHMTPSCLIMGLTEGANQISLKRWNVDTNSFVTDDGVVREYLITVPNKIELSEEPEFDGRFQESARFAPPTPVFAATRELDLPAGASTLPVVNYETQHHDACSNFTPSDGKFIADRAGEYQFSGLVVFDKGDGVDDTASVGFLVTRSAYLGGSVDWFFSTLCNGRYFSRDGKEYPVSVGGSIRLKTGDVVQLALSGFTDAPCVVARAHFSGYLVREGLST